ncbi:MAG: DUF1704 domain-containing protein [Deltaproteobacteria bacterium]|nr:DUF1704 domain-containing protein [Deltaproteobacteria bacterium]
MSRSSPPSRSLAAIERAVPLFDMVAGKTRLLDALSWPREVEEQFFADEARELPRVVYEVDRERANAHVRELESFAMTLDVSDPIQRWLIDVARSYADANRMILSLGTRRFHEISVEVYGGPQSRFDRDTSNLDLAGHLERRLKGEDLPAPAPPTKRKRQKDGEEHLDAKGFAKAIEALAVADGMKIDVQVDDRLSAKVVAGTERVRVRAGTSFRRTEVLGLFVHEVETHALTAQNGAAQRMLPFLKSGGPRTTRTQEGLAVFAEFHARAFSADRMRRIIRRVRLVEMAAQGADFLELYRWLVEQGTPERDAWFDAQRICRGGLIEGGAPFTKDASYLAGFCEVYNFLQIAVRGGAREALHLLACGRIALDDLAVLHELRELGVLDAPALLPRWMREWDALLPYFAFTSFLTEIDLGHVQERYRRLLDAARLDREEA